MNNIKVDMVVVDPSASKDWYLSKFLSKKATIGTLLYYFIVHLFILPLFFMVLISVIHDQSTAELWAQASSDFTNLFVFLILFLPLLEHSYRIMKQNVRFMILHSLKWYVPQVVCNAVVTYIIIALTNLQQSSNQAEVMKLFSKNILALAIPSLLVAPIVEELIFRGMIFRGLRKHGFWIASLVSCVSFGLLHVAISIFTGNYLDVIFTIPYALMGFFFCVAYEKTKTIFGCIFLHFVNNAIALLAMSLAASLIW